MESIRTLLIDDDVELGSLMREFFQENGVSLTVSGSGPDGLTEAQNGNFDIVLLDVMLPGFDGFEVLRKLRQRSGVPVIMLTARTESQSRIRGLETGADDYLPKPFDPLELLARVRAVMRRTNRSEPNASTLTIGGIRLDCGSRQAFRGKNSAGLTSVEYDMLEVLMRSAGRVVSRDELTQRCAYQSSSKKARGVNATDQHRARDGLPVHITEGLGRRLTACFGAS